jgi:hypothetical protein
MVIYLISFCNPVKGLVSLPIKNSLSMKLEKNKFHLYLYLFSENKLTESPSIIKFSHQLQIIASWNSVWYWCLHPCHNTGNNGVIYNTTGTQKNAPPILWPKSFRCFCASITLLLNILNVTPFFLLCKNQIAILES